MALRGLLVVLVLAAAGWPVQPAHAQGFFQQFFGGGDLPRPTPRPYPGVGSPYQSYGDGSYDRGGTYRTLCVRLCDGYYFPISFSTTRSEFARDADKCEASCGSEARLFYHPNPGGDVETMVDLSGMGYAQLPAAFKYRKTLVKGCACRPQPWSEAELERHRAYARGDTGMQVAAAPRAEGEVATPKADGEAPAQAKASSYDSPLAVARPEPVSRYVLPSQSQTFFSGGSSSPYSRNQSRSKVGSPAGLFR